MNPTDLGLLVLAVLAWAGVGLTHVLARTLHHDEMFLDVAPGVIPAQPATAPRSRLGGVAQEYAGEIPVAFAPPRGLRPGMVGTVIDSQVDSRDLTATLVDLGVRGHLTITATPATESPSAARKYYARRPAGEEPPRTDWILTRSADVAYDTLTPAETTLLDGLFHAGDTVRMSQLDQPALQALREVQVGLYREVVERGWYPRHPRQRGGAGCVLIGLGLLAAVLFVAVRHTVWGILAAIAVLGAAVMLSRVLRGRTPRTALGSAVRVQALGFKKYLATAEAEQFSFEEAAGIFSRYLPYAMVFGVAQHWARVFGEVAQNAERAGFDGAGYDLTWFDVAAVSMDAATDLLWYDALGLIDLDPAVSGALELGGDAVEGLSAFATDLGEFMGSLDFLDGLGDGCSADGCGDLGGCLDV